MSEKKSNVLTTFQWRLFDCELCHKPYPFCVSLNGNRYKLFDVERPEKGNFIILESLTKDKLSSRIIHVITPQPNKPVRLGRGHDSDVRIGDISVSRCHALLEMKADGFYLEDNISKFGTLVMIKSKEQLNSPVYKAFQVGRTLVFITMKNECDQKETKSPENALMAESIKSIEADLNIAEKSSEKEQFQTTTPALDQPNKSEGSLP